MTTQWHERGSPAPMPMHPALERRFPIGAEVTAEAVHFRVWAPRRERVEVAVEGTNRTEPLVRGPDGYFEGALTGLGTGTRYRFRLDGDLALPDPASRYQPEGPHGPSEVIDPRTFRWTDAGWRGERLDGQVIYELHIGTF